MHHTIHCHRQAVLSLESPELACYTHASRNALNPSASGDAK